MNTLVSVIIAVYNEEKYLENCIQSVLKQSLQDYEIILVNDGSTDGSAEIIARYAGRYPERFRVIEKANGGLASARNDALKTVEGRYVTFLDADDYIEEYYLETLAGTAEKYACDTVCSGQYKVDADGNIIKKVLFHPRNGKCLTRRLNISGKLYRAEYLKRRGIVFPDGKLYEDNSFNLQAFFLSDKHYFLSYAGYYQLVHEGSITSRPIRTQYLPLEEWRGCIRKILRERSPGVDLELFEFTLLSFFTYFLWVRNRKREYLSNENREADTDELLLIIRYCQDTVNEFFPNGYRNRYASLFRYRELVFTQRAGVKAFARLCHQRKLREFTKLFYRIVGKG